MYLGLLRGADRRFACLLSLGFVALRVVLGGLPVVIAGGDPEFFRSASEVGVIKHAYM
ncbi:hypothetical protein GA0115233_108211 [Streptomyces sp. DI166]|nr:hypothetical protein GA0115233_108211 [Streptomyces sp. DI166]